MSVGDGRVPTYWGPGGALSHPDASHPTENPPAATSKQGQQPGTGKIMEAGGRARSQRDSWISHSGASGRDLPPSPASPQDCAHAGS